jgi:acetyl esterase/lipase
MSPTFDPEYLEAVASFGPDVACALNEPAKHDIETRIAAFVKLITALETNLPTPLDMEETVHHVKAADGHDIPVDAFLKRGRSSPTTSTAALLHCHGGGMTTGSVTEHRKELANHVSRLGVPMFSVDYRLAPGHRDTGLVEDCYTGLVWLYYNADK